MPKERHKPKDVVARLRQVGALTAQGKSTASPHHPSARRCFGTSAEANAVMWATVKARQTASLVRVTILRG